MPALFRCLCPVYIRVLFCSIIKTQAKFYKKLKTNKQYILVKLIERIIIYNWKICVFKAIL